MQRLPYQIEYQPQLIEEAVLRAITGHPEEVRFRKERDAIYPMLDAETREHWFQELHQRWFEHLELGAPLREIFSQWPILKSATAKCLLLKARSQKDLGAELYVASGTNGCPERERRTLVMQLLPDLLVQTPQLMVFLRHELLHIVDMLDADFGYEPGFPKSEAGPIYDRLLQERYRVLWDITIAGRLYQQGWLPQAVREKHWKIFQHTFAGATTELERVFSFFFNNTRPKHQELVSFARTPEMWLVNADAFSSSKGRCSLCQFPSHLLIDPRNTLLPAALTTIQNENPDWTPHQPICSHCADLYQARTA